MDKFKIVLVFFMFSVFGYICGQTQNADSAYTRPLIDVLKSIETQFSIQIKYDQKLVEGQVLKYADWRIKPWSVDETLKAVLAPFDYTYTMDNEKYKIKPFEYARTIPAEGEKFLNYLKELYPDSINWERRKSELLSCLPVALGINGLDRNRLPKVILTKERKYEGYTIQNFALESLPGIYVCGSIYRPAKINGKLPVILNPNGHFGHGRYRADQQIRCAMQARMGAIAVSWDLFAWGEGLLQFPGTMHRMSAANTIQTWNAIRILDWLLSLKEADETRVGITGGSGGGSLTMMMAAIDDRIQLSIPVVMTSSHFVGGCPCESGMPAHLCGNRTNNAEISAMFAPKPQLIISDGKDWSHTVPQLELPYIRSIYEFYDNGTDLIENTHLEEEGHDYGVSKRKAMYAFVAKHFNLNYNNILNKDGSLNENTVTIEKESLMYAFGEDGQQLPSDAIKGKEAFIEVLKKIGIVN